MSKQVIYLTKEIPFFSEKYIKVRALENRVLSDSQVKQLPFISKDHPHYNEWQLRQQSTQRFIKYLEQKKESLTLLDIGCGNGWFTHKMAAVNTQNIVDGLDINKLELEQAVRVFRQKNCTFYYGDLFKIDDAFNKKYDIITLNASVQYFKNFETLLAKLLTFLSPKGEIHILDSPFYKFQEIEAAKKRTQEYYKKMGIPEMSEFYFHHPIEVLKDFDILYTPKKSIFKKILKKQTSPFYWVRYIKA
jgi:ubiquinone/menaquinone biosynthesis C-methylase UbiE